MSDALDDVKVYKVLPADSWRAAVARGRYAGSADDARDGFIHFSLPHQLEATLARHFRGASDLTLVELPAATLEAALRFEPSRDGALFPHLYGELDPALATRSWPLRLREDTHLLPAELSARTLRTHPRIVPRLCGTPLLLEQGRALVALDAIEEMAADARGLVHGGFTFGLADYAAMLAVNDPRVLLAAADCRFTAPCHVGERLFAHARTDDANRRKPVARVTVSTPTTTVFEGRFTCAIPKPSP